MNSYDEKFGIHVRLVRDETDEAIHVAEDQGSLPSETPSFGTHFYQNHNDALRAYLEMVDILEDAYRAENPDEILL